VKVVDVTFVGRDQVSVRLRPSLIARLLGARDVVVELVFEHGAWCGYYTRTVLHEMQHYAILKSALEAQPIDALPRAQRRLAGSLAIPDLGPDGP
jgi:hypothetical protein